MGRLLAKSPRCKASKPPTRGSSWTSSTGVWFGAPSSGRPLRLGGAGGDPELGRRGPPNAVQAFVFYTNGLALPGRLGGALPLGSFGPLKKREPRMRGDYVGGWGGSVAFTCVYASSVQRACEQAESIHASFED